MVCCVYIPSCKSKSRRFPIMHPDLAPRLTFISSNYPCLHPIFMVPKVFEPLKYDCIGQKFGNFLFCLNNTVQPLLSKHLRDNLTVLA